MIDFRLRKTYNISMEKTCQRREREEKYGELY